ncbi:MAG: hypothetical protein ACLU38_01750 [Dysosmobacter sp.]
MSKIQEKELEPLVNPTWRKAGQRPSMIRELLAYGLRRSAAVARKTCSTIPWVTCSIPAPQLVRSRPCWMWGRTTLDPIQVHVPTAGGLTAPAGRGGGICDPPLRMTIRPEWN